MGPRSTVAPPRCILRALRTKASYKGFPSKRSASPRKIRSNTASRGICTALPFVDRVGGDVSEPHACKTEADGAECVRHHPAPLSVAGEIECFQAECGKRSEASADPDHHKLAH